MKKNNKKGFTLAELLIVVAIIAVLTAIAIPVFTQQLERSREATDMSNVRAAYAEAMADYLAAGANSTISRTASARQTVASWQNAENGTIYARLDGTETPVTVPAVLTGNNYVVTVTSIADSPYTSVGVAQGAATSGS